MKRLLLILFVVVMAVPGSAQTITAKPEVPQWHPWKGKRVAYFGDSITDPRNSGSKKKYWGFLEDWLGITPYVYGVSGRQWNDIPRQAQKLQEEHGDSVDAILISRKQIVLLTPIHRAEFYANEKNWQPREDYTNKCGEYIDAYVQSVKEAGNLWAVPVMDLNALCGLYPLMDEMAQYFKSAENDRLHPNDEGHRRMALTLMYQLAGLPIF